MLVVLISTLCPLRIAFAGAADFAALAPLPEVLDAHLLWSSQTSAALADLTLQEREQLEQQRTRIDELSRSRLGAGLTGTRVDLTSLQKLLEARALDRRDRYRLQALGVVLGDVLVSEHGFEWIAHHDELGRNRALRHPETGRIVFPVTAISRRVEAGLGVDVFELFEQLESEGSPDGARQLASSGLVDPR